MAKVLIVEDSLVSRQHLARHIEKLGHESVLAGDGNVGLDLLRTERPACMFLDLLMPEMDGFEVLEQLRRDGCEVPVYVVTADIQATTKERVLKLGARALLKKPAQLSAVGEALEQALGASKP